MERFIKTAVVWVSSSIALISKYYVAGQGKIKKKKKCPYNYSICSFPQVWVFYLWNILSWEAMQMCSVGILEHLLMQMGAKLYINAKVL